MAEPAEHDAAVVDHLNHEPFVRGSMPIGEQTNTFEKVFDVGMVRMGSLSVACIVLFLVLTFCTGAGWGVGVVIPLVLLVAGGVFLRKQPTSDVTH